tara:strand:- start:27 stop:839 length:813 start_codon:yes stop_codon:yes gene_type:complete
MNGLKDTENGKMKNHIEKKYLAKLKNQGNIASFFDGFLTTEYRYPLKAGYVFLNFLNSKKNRFTDFESRLHEKCLISNQKRTSEMSITLSQGTHSVFRWKNYIAFKSVFDLALYSMLITELKPNIIIEIGSGGGGSAIWLADMMKILGLKPKVYSYDITKPDINYPGINFIQFDLNTLNNKGEFPKSKDWKGVKLVIEDAHANVPTVLDTIDGKLNKGDYFVIEDNDAAKQKEVHSFILRAKHKYLLDQYYLDFFGRNGTSAIDSILKRG